MLYLVWIFDNGLWREVVVSLLTSPCIALISTDAFETFFHGNAFKSKLNVTMLNEIQLLYYALLYMPNHIVN